MQEIIGLLHGIYDDSEKYICVVFEISMKNPDCMFSGLEATWAIQDICMFQPKSGICQYLSIISIETHEGKGWFSIKLVLISFSAFYMLFNLICTSVYRNIYRAQPLAAQ